MSNGCSEKDADLSCLDRPKFKLLRYHKFLTERNYTVKELFSIIEYKINNYDITPSSYCKIGPADLEIYSDTDPEELRMNGEIHFNYNGQKSVIKVTEFMRFVNLIQSCMDI